MLLYCSLYIESSVYILITIYILLVFHSMILGLLTLYPGMAVNWDILAMYVTNIS